MWYLETLSLGEHCFMIFFKKKYVHPHGTRIKFSHIFGIFWSKNEKKIIVNFRHVKNDISFIRKILILHQYIGLVWACNGQKWENSICTQKAHRGQNIKKWAFENAPYTEIIFCMCLMCADTFQSFYMWDLQVYIYYICKGKIFLWAHEKW